MRGDLDHFPFDDPKHGEFKISGRVTEGVLDYAPGWPKFTDVTADLAFDGRKLRITSPRASAFGVQLAKVTVNISDLFGKRTDVIIQGEGQGPLADFLKFIAESPVRRFIDGATDGWTGDGRAHLALQLALPLDQIERSKVAGVFRFANNTLNLGLGRASRLPK